MRDFGLPLTEKRGVLSSAVIDACSRFRFP